MAGRQNIVQYRERLDRTLASHDLVDEKSLAALVKDQVLCSPQYETQGLMDELLGKRTVEVLNFIDMLRSASEKGVPKGHGKQHSEWKLKQDTEDCRIMYREGPQGTPFHTLLVEGYVDAPLDVCLCVSWESALYKKWWPQFSIPTFKILSCKCLQSVHINEQISALRIKLSWPLSAREGIVHFFEFEYIQGDLVIVLMNSISDLEAIGVNFGESSDDGMAEEKNMVKIDMVGGFALQKVTPERSYFRTIANLDFKMDFVPPWFINFLSRQIIGSGFKLYRKTVALVYKGDEDFNRALESSLYARVHDTLYTSNVTKGMLEPEDLKNGVAQIIPKEHPVKSIQADVKKEDHSVLGDHDACKTLPGIAQVMDQEANGEIREEKDDSFILQEANDEIREEKVDPLILPKECLREARVEEEEIEQSIQNDEDFNKALECSLYARVHDALYTSSVTKGMLEPEDLKIGVDQICPKEHSINSTQANVKKEDHSDLGDHSASKSLPESAPVMDQEAYGEIRKEKGDSVILPQECLREIIETDVIDQKTCTELEEEEAEQSMRNEEVLKNCGVNNDLKISIRPEVEQALETLEKVISLVQNLELGPQTTFPTPFNSVDLQAAQSEAKFLEGLVSSNAGTCIEASNNKPAKKTTLSDLQNSSGIHRPSCMDASVCAREVHHNRIAPASSPEQNLPLQHEIPSPPVALLPIIEDTIEKNSHISSEANGISDKSHAKRRELKNQEKQKLCCVPFKSRHS